MIYIYPILALGLGIIVGIVLRKYYSRKQVDSAEIRAQKILAQAKVKGQEIFFKARETALEVVEKAKEEEIVLRKEMKERENKLEQRQNLFEKKILQLEEKQSKLAEKADRLEQAKVKIKQAYQEAAARLEKISGMTREEAKQALMENLEKDLQEDIVARVNKFQKISSEEIDKEAKKMITLAIERCTSSHAAEVTKTSVTLPSDEMKGRVIGREGRNIKVLEQCTGTEVVVDDTPEVVFISAFSPIRRVLAKKSLEKLIADGRIQPARIEKTVEEVKKELARDIRKAGEEAAYKVGLVGLDPDLIRLIGRLKYRSSFGQNVLQHSIEVAELATLLASDLGANVSVAKKAGFLHDIGKAKDHETEGTHPEIGKEIAEKFGFPQEVVIPIATHHDDHPPTLEAVIVKVADAISGAREGARYDTYERYIKRLESLEGIAKRFPGVKKSYAIQGGRELRVFVKPEKISDLEATKMARGISDEIEKELKYPGEIKVTVIRENRITEYAR